MSAWSHFVLKHRRVIAGAWLLIAVVGLWASSTLGDALSPRFDVEGKPGFETNAQIQRLYGTGGSTSPLLVVATLERPDDAPAADRALARVAAAVPDSRSVTDSPALRSEDGLVRGALIFARASPSAPETTPEALAQAQRAAAEARTDGTTLRVTGVEALSGGGEGGGAGLLVEILVGATGALVVLALVFGSLLALVPLLVAAISILTTFVLVRGFSELFEISIVVQFLVGLIGLGVAIDYSLLLVVRWREERDAGHDSETAVHRAMDSAGRAIIVSGTTVGIGLLALVVVPVPFIRSIGFGGLLIPVVSVLVTLSLLPGILVRVGARLDRRREGHETDAGKAWTRWATWVVRHRWPAAIVGLAITITLAFFALSLRPGDPSVDALASSGPARDALVAVERAGLGSGTATPIEVLTPEGGADATADRLRRVEGIRAAVAPDSRAWRRDGQAVVLAFPRSDAAGEAGQSTVDRVRDLHSAEVQVGGVSAETRDLTEAIYGAFPLMIAVIAVLTFLLLARALRSIVLPLKAVLLNLLSVAAAFGVVVLVWQNGHGSELIAGVPGTGTITPWVPLAAFAFLYGLSMDYEVFILSRMREEYDATGSTQQAVIRGLGRTGRLVTSAALILVFAFVALGAGPETEIKIFATALAVGIALDATVVRALIVPALVALFGHVNWWPGRRGPGPHPPSS